MTSLTPHFYNSLTKTIEPLSPQEPGKVRIYNCGPTVYKRQHLGNMRRFLFSDVLRRTLELLGFEVREITNITDVGHLTNDDLDEGEDKIEKAAQTEKTTPQAIAEKQISLFQQDLQAINIQPAHLYPRASQHIKEMQEIIAKLLEKDIAYQTPSGIYFSVEKFPNYGELSGNTLENLHAGSRIEVREEKMNPADFALWKFDKQHLQQWDSPWGKGYPGWHIECSAMSNAYLGMDIDIHTGGEDNKFPHHENELAQSEGAFGETFVRIWMHNAHLQMQGQKIAKREGQQLTIDTLLEKNLDPLAFRLFVLSGHYRQKLDLSWDIIAQAQEHIKSLANLLRRLHGIQPVEVDKEILEQFRVALADDLNTSKAVAIFLEYMRHANAELDNADTPPPTLQTIYATLKAMDHVMGIVAPLEQRLSHETIPSEVKKLAEEREQARQQKDFELADSLRSAILHAGYTVEDTTTGPRLIPKAK